MKLLFRYSWWDSLPVAITFIQLILNIWLAATWESRSFLANLLFYPPYLFLFWYNALVATHNFVHTPWFTPKFLNRFYAIVNSVNLGSPITHYYHIHFNHHRYGNDRQDDQGRTQDYSSTFAYGKNDQSENVIRYCALAIVRDDLSETFRQVNQLRHRDRNDMVQLCLELGVCILAAIGYLLLSWKYLLCFAVPVFYCGWFLTYLANYYEHFGATPESQYANSTSYYGRIYNWLFCNEGYHQEHHLRPQIHWSQRPKIYRDLRQQLNSVDRVILNVPPPLGFLHHKGKTVTPVRQKYPAEIKS
jgi:fatty acid desaturase